MKVGIIGCGKMGQKRARNLAGAELVIACDTDLKRAKATGAPRVVSDWQEVVGSDVDIVIVSTTHDMLAVITSAAACFEKWVLVEKPGARCREELAGVRRLIRVGFNHRYHPAIRKAYEIAKRGEIGEIMHVRGVYGHGGRPGYEKEWRMNRELSGGGELLDQGSHLIDLARWFLGDFENVQGRLVDEFWRGGVEDNAYLTLTTRNGDVAYLHASWTEWKNNFRFEIFGDRGKLEINGLGGSYGVETLTLYEMKSEMGPPNATTWRYYTDDSFKWEFQDFLEDIRLHRQPSPGIDDALAVLEITDQLYREGHT